MATLQIKDSLTIACSVLFIPSSVILTALRFYTRRRQNAHLGVDDWLMIPALILVLAMQVTMIVEICRRMIGYADPNFVPGKVDASSNLAFWPFELEQIPALSLIKISVIYFYRRIFNTGATPYLHWSTMIMVGLMTAWTVAFFFSFLFICGGTPEYYWLSAAIEKQHCVATQTLHLVYSITDTIFDILVLLMAVPMIWSLHMSMGRKLAVTGIFSLGLITVAASITRMAVFVSATTNRYNPYLDFEYLITNCMYWSMLETGLGFIAANLVVVYGLFARAKPMGAFVHSLRSLIPARFTKMSSTGDSAFQSAKNGRGWPQKESGSNSSAGSLGKKDEPSITRYEVHVKHEFGTAREIA